MLREQQAANNATSINSAPGIAAASDSRKLTALVERKLAVVEAQRSKAEYFHKAVKSIVALKLFISLATSQEPHAALAWTGVSLLLPVSVSA